MAQSIEIPVSLTLQDAQQQIDTLRELLNKAVRMDSSAFKDISRYLDKLQDQASKLKGKMGDAFKTSSSSQQFLRQYEDFIRMLEGAGDKFTNLKLDDIAFSAEDAETIKNIRTEIESLSKEITNLEKGKIGNIFADDTIKDADIVREIIKGLGKDVNNLTFSQLSASISSELQKVNNSLDMTKEKVASLRNQINTLQGDSLEQLSEKINKAAQESVSSKNFKSGVAQADYASRLNSLFTQYGYTGKQEKTTGSFDSFFENQSRAIGQWGVEIKNNAEQAAQQYREAITKIYDVLNENDGKLANGEQGADRTRRAQEIIDSIFGTNNDFTQVAEATGRTYKEKINAVLKELNEGLSKEEVKINTPEQLIEAIKAAFDTADFDEVIDVNKFKSKVTLALSDLKLDKSALNNIFEDITKGMSPDAAFQSIINKLEDLKKRLSTEADGLSPEVQKLEEAKQRLESAMTATNTGQESADQGITERKKRIQELSQEIQKLIDQYNQLTGESIHIDTSGLQKGQKQLEAFNQTLDKFENKQKALSNVQMAVTRWMGFWQVLNLTKSAINDMINHIKELDQVMTQISVVTNFSQDDLWNQISTYSEIARQYGVAIKGVYEVSQIYYQQGLQQNDVMTLTTETLKMARIAGLDYATAADYMTTAIRGFKLEMQDAAHVTDVFSALAATTASSTEELAVAISKTASSAEAVGSSFEATSAMMATMIATTRESATNIGTALKSVISRLN